MNEYQKMLELLLYEGKKKLKITNPLIDKITEYLYRILSLLIEDLKSNKVQIMDEQRKEFFEEIEKLDFSLTEIKCRILDEDYRMRILMELSALLQNKEIECYLNSSSFYKRHKIKKYELKMLHCAICKDIFYKIENSYESGNVVWVGIDSECDEESDFTLESVEKYTDAECIKIEVISEDILAYDRYVFDILGNPDAHVLQYIKEIYRPYIVEYYIDKRGLDEAQNKFLLEMCKSDGWYRASFANESIEIDEEKNIVYDGIFVYSASPVVYSKKRLVIQDTQVDKGVFVKIDKTYNMSEVKCTPDGIIKRELERIFKNIKFRNAKVYKVGNGNCIYNYGKKGSRKRRFFYDVGFDMNAHIDAELKNTENKYRAALKNIRRATPHCIILSHWDEDHYRGCIYARKDFFYTRWIAPNIEACEKKGNAKRLFLYLYKIGSLMVVSRKERYISVEPIKNSKFILYIGKRVRGKDKKISKCNCQGIAIYIENSIKRHGKIRCMMQGDVPYLSLPAQADFRVNNPYEYLVVPHHGAEMDCSLLTATRRGGHAVICCTGDIGRNRPHPRHLFSLRKCYKDIKCTESAKCYIKLNLCRDSLKMM